MRKLFIAILLLLSTLHAQITKEIPVSHAKGSFDVKVVPAGSAADPTLSSFTLDKQIHGDLEGTSKGTMISAGDPKTGSAGYVAIERVTGTLAGKSGSFALMHNATMKPGAQEMHIVVVPGSGTGGLQGIDGTFTIHIDSAGKHTYTFDYTIPK